MLSTYIIAEVGVNHNGDIKLAHRLIDEAVAVGANAVKFQTAIPELVATPYAEKAKYQKISSISKESQLEMIRRVHFPLDAYIGLQKYCEQKRIEFFSSAFDMKSLAFLEKLGQPYHKVPSGEITNLPYLREIGKYGRNVIISSGMATMKEIEAAILVLENEGLCRNKITVLHCTTEYPTPLKDVNLRAMLSISKKLNVSIGYSDHTAGLEVSIAAVAMGACMIEKHFTLSKDLPGPDHNASLEPFEFKSMVNAIRNIEQALGGDFKAPSSVELQNKIIVRRSLVAATKIKKGELFTPQNVIAKRPGNGLCPMNWDDVIGTVSLHDYEADDFINK